MILLTTAWSSRVEGHLMTCERPVDGPGCLPQLWSSRASARPAWVVVGSLVVVVRGAGGCLQRNSQDLWIGVSRGFWISSLVSGSFDELALLEPGAGADEGD